MDDNTPSVLRVLAALPIAPLPSLLILLALMTDWTVFSFEYLAGAWPALVVVELIAIVVGGISAALLLHRIEFSLLSCTLTGGFVAILPFLLIVFFTAIGGSTVDASINGTATVIDGSKTLYGYWQDTKFFGILGLLGGVGGAFFYWLCTVRISHD